MPEILVATQSFATVRDGQKVYVRVGQHAHAGHWLVKAYPEAFKPIEVAYPEESQSSAAPRTKAFRQ